MKFVKHATIGLILLAGYLPFVSASGNNTDISPAWQAQDSVRIYFKQSKIDFVPDLNENQKNLDRITDSLRNTYTDSLFKLLHVEVVGGASPEGSIKFNKWLSEERAKVLFNYLSRFTELPESIRTTRFLGRDWRGLIRLVRLDENVPYREETLVLLEDIANEAEKGSSAKGDHLKRIKKLRGGVPYEYMYTHLFPILRASQINLLYQKVMNPMKVTPEIIQTLVPEEITDKKAIEEITPLITNSCRPFYMGVKTNMLYDLIALPNIGVEFYLGKNWTVSADWMYGWWKTDRRHRYWRAYGGNLNLRWWFGSAAHRKPMTGHHIGIYGQLLTYDFEWGGKGYMGGEPGRSLWDRAHWGGGIEYGYSLPIARRFNIDFNLGLGYLGGRQYEYRPEDGHYVWQQTKKRHWFGPTKLEVSLVWLLGCENYNVKRPKAQKGGVKE